MSKKAPVHIVTVETILGDVMYYIPAKENSWVGKAIRDRIALPHWNNDIPGWLIESYHEELLMDAIEDAADTDEAWCADCMNWLEDYENPMCEVIEKMGPKLEESGCLICHDGDEDEDEDDEDEGEEEGTVRGFSIPESIKKMAMEEGGAIGQFIKGRVKDRMIKEARAAGLDMSDELMNELFESLFNSFKGKVVPGDTKMSREEAAIILGITLPCNNADVVAAFRRKAKETHPDMPGGSNEAFMKVSAAREALSQ